MVERKPISGSARRARLYAECRSRISQSTAHGESLEVAVLDLTRSLIEQGRLGDARRLLEETRSAQPESCAADLGLAIAAAAQGFLRLSFDRFDAAPRAIVRRLAMGEFLETAFKIEPEEATRELAGQLESDARSGQSPETRWKVIQIAYANREVSQAAHLLNALLNDDRALGRPDYRAAAEWLSAYMISNPRSAHKAIRGAGLTNDARAQTIPTLAILDYRQPNLSYSSKNLGDYIQSLAFAGNLARLSNVEFVGDVDLVAFVNGLKNRVPDRLKDSSLGATLCLAAVNRDAASDASVPPGTWMIVYGWYMSPSFDGACDFPFDKNLRPIFLSFHVNREAILTSEAIDYLKAHGPIGCRDWSTVYLLLNLGVPAFFSGCLTTTLDNLFERGAGPSNGPTAFVDARVQDAAHGIPLSHAIDGLRENDLRANLQLALERMESYRFQFGKIVTSRLHCYLPAKAVGCTVKFDVGRKGDARFDGLTELDGPGIEAMGSAIRTTLCALLKTILEGRSEKDIYRAWGRLCRQNVAIAERRSYPSRQIPGAPPDIADLCTRFRAAERVYPARQLRVPAAIDLATVADGRDKLRLATMICSAVFNTNRAIRAWVICRGFTSDDFERFAAGIPEVEFHFISLDRSSDVALPVARSDGSATTSDSIAIPSILLGIDRVAFVDVYSLFMDDLAALSETDLAGCAIAAKPGAAPERDTGMSLLNQRAGALPRFLARDLRPRICSGAPLNFSLFDPGVMVLDLRQMRASRFSENAYPYVGKFGFGQMEAFNFFARGDYRQLDDEWNARPAFEPVNNAKLLRWPGHLNPWNNYRGIEREAWQSMNLQAKRRLLLA